LKGFTITESLLNEKVRELIDEWLLENTSPGASEYTDDERILTLLLTVRLFGCIIEHFDESLERLNTNVVDKDSFINSIVQYREKILNATSD
jgi:hypothetical protein